LNRMKPTIPDLDLDGRVPFRDVLHASDDLRHVCDRAIPQVISRDGDKGGWAEDISRQQAFRAPVNHFLPRRKVNDIVRERAGRKTSGSKVSSSLRLRRVDRSLSPQLVD
jgi:hypothetical protein